MVYVIFLHTLINGHKIIPNLGRRHGSLTLAGKVRAMTPKVDRDPTKKRIPNGRAGKRIKCSVNIQCLLFPQKFLFVQENSAE